MLWGNTGNSFGAHTHFEVRDSSLKKILNPADYLGIPSAAMIRKFVGKYPQDPTYTQLCSAVEAGDWEAAFRASHTMKGLAQNLNFDRLYRVSLALTEALRGREPLTDYSLLDAVSAEHTTLIDAISQLDN